MSIFLVAVVEDDRRVLNSLENLLGSAGYEVLQYATAEEFLGSGRLAEINCLISDVGLPGMSGLDLLRVLQAQRGDLPVVLITARNEEALLHAIASAGARHVFLKPFDGEELLKAIAALE